MSAIDYKKKALEAKEKNKEILAQMQVEADALKTNNHEVLKMPQASKSPTKAVPANKNTRSKNGRSASVEGNSSRNQKIILQVPSAENKSEKINLAVTPSFKEKLDKARIKHGYKTQSAAIVGIFEWFFEQDGIT